MDRTITISGRSSADPAAPEGAVDGRRLRSQRSRERILDAVAATIIDAEAVLTPETIAAGAGVSVSTIFRQFGDMEGLAAAMRERVAEKVLPYLLAGPFEGEPRARVRELLRRVTAIFEIVGPLQRASLRQPRRSRGAQATHENFLNALRAQITTALAPELESDADTARIIEAILSLGAWTNLRLDQGAGVKDATALLERAVLCQLGLHDSA